MKPARMYVAIAAAALVLCGTAAADSHAPPMVKVGIETCLPTVSAKYPGEVLQAVLKVEGKEPVWEFEIEGPDGKLWDVECSGASGKIVEFEQRVKSADDPAFKAKAKISEDAAKKTVLEKFPGEVERTEYEIEADGSLSYEFDIKLKAGGGMRVEVDAVSGKIVESSREYLEVGRVPK